MKYEVIIYWSNDDDAFVAEVPELPGCMADGRTYREALRKLEGIAREWIEVAKELGREIPQPKGKIEVRVRHGTVENGVAERCSCK